MSDLISAAREIGVLVIDGRPLNVNEIYECSMNCLDIELTRNEATVQRVDVSQSIVSEAVACDREIYGVTTGFGSMADVVVPGSLAADSQNNLLSFLASSAGDPIDRRHVRAAMLLRANMLLRGDSGIRLELIERLVHFLQADAIPVVNELGSIGASGDLVPLSTIARAITGQTEYCRVEIEGEIIDGRTALHRLGLEPVELLPKEGLALINGTSFSSAIAANTAHEASSLLAICLVTNAMMLRALNVQRDAFDPLVHARKPHPGQVWVAETMRRLLFHPQIEHRYENGHVQDRYSLRCLPQYLGPSVETLSRVIQTVETEMNGVSDNPLIDPGSGRFIQNGNFLGQYIAVAMDELRSHLGLLAKHLDVQIAQLVSPEFNLGLPASLRGNDETIYNMGLKGLQITGNSIMPLLTYYGNPLVSHYPTHAEQFNQNVNGLSWGSANLAWKSVELFQIYSSISLIFAVQALDLRCKVLLGHCDGRALLGDQTRELYESVYRTLDVSPGEQRPFLFDDRDQWLEEQLSRLTDNLRNGGSIVEAVQPTLDSWDEFHTQN
jgi:phenylalanine ammonia-lyase